MTFFRRQVTFAAGTLAVVSAIAGIVAWWLPSSAAWLDRHGFAAWPLAMLLLVLFIWAAANWYRASQQLAANGSFSALVEEDKRLFKEFKDAIPKDSRVLYWLKSRAESRSYSRSDIAPLSDYVQDWRASNQHFINSELQQAAIQFTEAAFEFLLFQGRHSHWAPQALQTNTPDDPVFFAYDYDGIQERIVIKGLGERADRVLEAHDELYTVGSRLGL